MESKINLISNTSTSFSIFLFSNLCAKEYDLILPAIKGDKKSYVASTIRILQRSTDKEKLIRILDILGDMKQVPIVSNNFIIRSTMKQLVQPSSHAVPRESHLLRFRATYAKHSNHPNETQSKEEYVLLLGKDYMRIHQESMKKFFMNASFLSWRRTWR